MMLWWSVDEILELLFCKNQNKDQNNRLVAIGELGECKRWEFCEKGTRKMFNDCRVLFADNPYYHVHIKLWRYCSQSIPNSVV